MRNIVLLLFLFAYSAIAHPVIYKKGWVYWGNFSGDSNNQRVSYTFHPRYAVEVNMERGLFPYSKEGDEEASNPLFNPHEYTNFKVGINSLLKRWYLDDSQANIYVSLQLGHSIRGELKKEVPKKEVSETSGNAWSMVKNMGARIGLLDIPTNLSYTNKLLLRPQIDVDWESRKYYTALSASVDFFIEGDDNSFYQLMYRVGMAPYIGKMKELQTWVVLQMDYAQYGDEASMKVTPMMRFFYRNTLWELGSSLSGDFFLTIMLHH